MRRVTQEAFDALIAENVDAFGMETAEALEEAIAALKLQGVDVSNLRTTVPEEGGRQELRAVVATRALAKGVEALTSRTEENTDAICALLDTLCRELVGPDVEPDAVQSAGASSAAVAWPVNSPVCPTDLHANLQGREGAVAVVLQALAHLCSSECDAPGSAYRALLLTLLTLQSLLACDETRATFVAEKGPDVLVQRVLRTRYADVDVASRCARALTAAATQHENAKVSLFRAGAADALLDALKAHTSNAGVAADVCTALTAIATPDDRRVAASSAFAHGRHLYSQDAYVPLMEIVRKHSDSDRTVAAACYALRAVAVNDEACERMVDAGVVEAGVRLLVRQLEDGDAPCIFLRPALVMLRQLAGSDVVKSRFISASGLEPLVGILVASCAPPGVSTCEQALALCAALSLRNPDFVAAAATVGSLDAALDAMTAHPQSAGVQRAAAMFIRNCAARNADVRPMLLDRGAEPLLRAAKKLHPSACADVGSAALRDLGADNYNEGWTPTTVYMGAEGQLYTYDDLGHDDTD